MNTHLFELAVLPRGGVQGGGAKPGRSGSVIAALTVALGLVGFAGSALESATPVSPPPAVAPLIGDSYSNDADRDGVEDQLAVRSLARRSAIGKQPGSPVQVEVEVIFKQPITTAQLDAFRNLGGEITHVYRALSYGWTGRMPLEQVTRVPAAMGANLALIEEAKSVQAHLDVATRTARVRPVWNAGFAGSPQGFAGSSNITIGIIDSGMDATHPDLAGRGVFWRDYSTDAATAPDDYSQHATHICSIATGTGISSGASNAPLASTLIGTLSGFFSGNYVTTAYDFPPGNFTFTATAIWNGGSTTTLQLMSHDKGTKFGWVLEGAAATGASPLQLTTSVTGSTNKEYSPVLVSNGAITDYAIRFQIPEYPGVDGFNRLRGVAPGCRWAAAKVFAANGNSLLTWTTAALDDLVADRVTNNIKIVNLSLGTSGNPGISTSTRQKVNTAVNNGLFVVCSGGNDGLLASATARQTDDPGRAALALTVAAANDVNQLTDYSSQGFGSPGSVAGQEEDYKPDLLAPGGSSYYSAILAADSNSGDRVAFADQQPDDYWASQGTSFAAPFAAGAGALVMDALQRGGTNWDFTSPQHALLVKMLLCATATESNQGREGGLNNPTLQRAAAGTNGFPVGKDQYEGYGMLNADAAVEVVAQGLVYGTSAASFGAAPADRRAWGRRVHLAAGQNLAAALTVPTGADCDLYLYSFTPGPFGQPVILASSTQTGAGVGEFLAWQAPTNSEVFVVVKRITGDGDFELEAQVTPQAGFEALVTNGPGPLLVAFTNRSVGAQSQVWDFGDGTGSSAPNPEHTYVNRGAYSVTLMVSNIAGAASLTRTNYILVSGGGLLVAAPGTIDFGLRPVGRSAQVSLVISNAGGGVLTGTATLSSAEFSLLGGSPFLIAGSATTNLFVQFMSPVTGVFSNAIVIATDGGNATNTLLARAMAPPPIVDWSLPGDQFGFAFETVVGFNYRIEFRNTMGDANWQTLQTQPGDGLRHELLIPSAGEPERYFRLRIE